MMFVSASSVKIQFNSEKLLTTYLQHLPLCLMTHYTTKSRRQ